MDFLGYLLVSLLLISIGLNLVLLKKVRDLNRELREVGARVSVTKDELAAIRSRLERMKEKFKEFPIFFHTFLCSSDNHQVLRSAFQFSQP